MPRAAGAPGDSRWDALEGTLPLVYVAEFDRVGTLRYISDVVEQWTGHAAAEFLRDSELWYECIHPDDVGRVRDAEQQLFDSAEQLNLEYRIVGPDDEARWVWERNTIVRDGRGAPICTHGTILDLSRFGAEQVDGIETDAHAALLIRRNFLTGLPSRQVLPEHLALALARAERDGDVVALLDLDLDRFRGINDTVGHAGGDIVLAQVANRLRQRVPAGDLLLHSGADEFLVMLAGLPIESAEATVNALAGSISQALLAPFEVAGRRLELRASVGYAIGPQDGRDPEELHRAAHAAVAAAKAAGRGELRRYRAGAADALREMSVDHRLRRAIERDAVKPHFQPIVDLSSGRICAAEALVRWETDTGELLPPARFVPAAEESSLIIDLDVHMIRRVCEASRRLQDLGHVLPVHVNVSARIASWHGFVRVVLQAIDVAGIQPSDLTVELTETAAVGDTSAGLALIELADAGVTLAMDDFGSAYSSVARLRMLPVTVVKIDRTMVLAVTGELPGFERIGPASRTPEAGATTLAGVLQMGAKLGLRTIVEGVETAKVGDLVKDFGADMAQGYLYGRPAPFDDLVETLRLAGRSPSD
ncbi:MAG TPA: GGDEF and EAL domain-containing protein [Solirubrobacteraceae bacterium]|jgi:diguanylate cyclase (GGDEF)-like protein|nr:GGDEF and EAL domain-containing protein [Solirubrobacteraceae bacterium]